MPPRRRPDCTVTSDDEDDISLTSTVADGGDDDTFDVDCVYAERQNGRGQTEYLISWTGFPMYQCTWEPDENLGDELREMWENDKTAAARRTHGEIRCRHF